MTSIQIHVPATEEEYDAIPIKSGLGPRMFEVWPEEGGWCSACRERPRRVVHLGDPDRNVAICGHCLSRVADAMRAPAPQSDLNEKGNG